MADNFLIYTHNNKSEDTIGKFFNRNKNLTTGISLVDFLRFRGKSGDNSLPTNAERILSKYNTSQDFKYSHILNKSINSDKKTLTDDMFYDLPLNVNTMLNIPKGNFKEELISVRGKNLFTDNSAGYPNIFFSDNLIKLLNDPLYVKSENIALEGREISVEIINENVKVWIWSRALNKIVNVSAFVTNMNVQKSDVGSFNLQLLPISDPEELMFIDTEDLVSYFNINRAGKSNLDFFYKNFQHNDIIFIRFEHLQNEKVTKESFINNFFVDKSKLPGNIWDMIGLVDNVQQSTFYNNSDYVLNISGRDLMKLLIEDGSYFLSLRYINNGESNFTFGYNRDDKWFKRNIADKNGSGGFVSYYFPYSNRRIDDTIGFIINQLCNIGITTNEDLFSFYPDKTELYSIKEGEQDLRVNEVNGIWQIIKVFFDRALNNRRVVDSSVAFVDSTIMEQFNKICQKPFVEFFGDTYGDEFNFIVRQPPFTKDSIQSFLSGKFLDKDIKSISKGGYTEKDYDTQGTYKIITLNESDIQGYGNMQWDETFYSWYQLNPQDAMLGKFSEVMMGGFIPIVYFDKIAQIYGNKRMVITDNYLSANVMTASESDKDTNTYKRALLNDLKFVIDTNSYLPFTRRGTITIPKGDRRIKRGTFIKVEPTGEIFYVESVSNSVQFSPTGIDRSTTLTVSHGMLEEYIWGSKGYDENGEEITKDGKPINFSYFDIVKFIISQEEREVIEEVEQEKKEYSEGVLYNVMIPSKSRIAYENNNPANLQFANQKGALEGEPRRNKNGEITTYWAKFNSPEDGFIAVINQIKLDASNEKGRNHTLRSFIQKYAPASENKTEDYIKFMTKNLGVPDNTKLISLDPERVAELIVLKESETLVNKKTGSGGNKVEKAVSGSGKKVSKTVVTDKVYHELVEEQFDFFMRRRQFNKGKYGRGK